VTLTKRERSMVLVALDNLICDFRKAEKRAKRRDMPHSQQGCADAIRRYTALARKFMAVTR